MSVYTEWKTAVSTSATDLETLRRLKACEISAIELSVAYTDCLNIDWAGLRAHADETGIELWSYHLPFAGFINIAAPEEMFRRSAVAFQCGMIDRALAIGISRFIIHPSAEPIPNEERAAWMASAKKSLAELAQYAGERGAVICVEDLPRSCLAHTSEELLELTAVDPRLRVCFDVNHLCQEFGETHREFIEKLGSLIVTTHMSDYDFVDEKHFFAGNGMIDWKSLVEDLEAAGYSGPFLYEGGFEPSPRAPEVPFGRFEDARERHLHIKEFRGSAI